MAKKLKQVSNKSQQGTNVPKKAQKGVAKSSQDTKQKKLAKANNKQVVKAKALSKKKRREKKKRSSQDLYVPPSEVVDAAEQQKLEEDVEMLPSSIDEVQIGDQHPKSRYAEIDLTEIISRLILPNDNARQTVENAWHQARKAGKLESWLALPEQKDLKAECEVEFDKTATENSEFVPSAKAEEKVVEQLPEDKKRGKQKFCRDGSPLDAIHKLVLMQREPSGSDLAYSLQALMKHAIDTAPAHLLQGVKNAFRSKLMKKMQALQTPSIRSQDPDLDQLYKTAQPGDFIVAILMEVADPKCTNERMQDVIGFLNSQYQLLGDQFDYEQLKIKNSQFLDVFFTVYASMIAFGDQNLGWNLNMLKHVVHLDLIHIFVVSTNDRFVPGEKPDDKKLTNLLKKCTAEIQDDRRRSPYSKMMCAIKSVYPQITDSMLRYAIKRPHLFCNKNMFEKLNRQENPFQALAVILISRVLALEESLTSIFDQITKICQDHSPVIEAILQRFKNVPEKQKLQRLSFAHLKDLIASGVGKERYLWIEQIKNREQPLVIVDQVEATKAKTVITDAMDEKNEEKFLTTSAGKELIFQEFYALAKTIQGEFVTKKREGGYLVPKKYQMCMAADLAARICQSKKVRMTLAAGQGKTMVYLLTAMLLHRKFPQQYEKILVVTISNPLQRQLEGIIINHPIDVSIKATYQSNIDEYQGFSLIIVDEADRYIRQTGASFREVNGEMILQGIHCFGETPLLLCSATFGRLESQIVMRVLKIQEANCVSYQSAKEFHDGVKIQPLILALPMVKNSLKNTLQDYFLKHRTQPVIVFFEQKDDKLLSMMKKMTNQFPGNFCAVNNEQELTFAIDKAARAEHGVYALATGFGRGIDFKFAKDAFVLVIMNGDLTLNREEVYQMAGRGNRTQGTPAADVLILSSKDTAYKGNILDSILNINSGEGVTAGVEMLEVLSKDFSKMKEEFKKRIAVEMTTDDAWTKGFSAIKDSEVSSWLNGLPKQHLEKPK